jgi:hypothetical protein
VQSLQILLASILAKAVKITANQGLGVEQASHNYRKKKKTTPFI